MGTEACQDLAALVPTAHPVGFVGVEEMGVPAPWLVDIEGWVLLRGDLQHLGQSLALARELNKCAQLNFPTPRARASPVITPPTLSLAHFGVGGRGVSIEGLRVWNQWLHQELSPERCLQGSGGGSTQTQSRGRSGSCQKALGAPAF